MKKPFFSIIIPTYNEEKYLPKTLKSLKRQTFKDFEIIVSDSNSEDKTVEIAKKYGAKVIIGSKKGPGAGRNLGIKKAKGKWLLFLDADTYLKDENALEKVYEIIKAEKNLSGGAFRFKAYDGNIIEHTLFKAADIILRISYLFKNYVVPGFSFFVKADVIKKLGGFNETLPFAEDHDIARRIKKRRLGKMRLVEIFVFTSARRLKKLGILQTLKQYLVPTAEYYLKGKINGKKHKFIPASQVENRKMKIL